jgi:hypothetical protein
MPLEDVKERTKALDIAVGQIEKQFGKGSIMRLGQRGLIAPVESISTGSISIDYALGIGGLPRGRVSTRWTRSMRRTSASISTICSCRSPTTASRPSRLSRCWCGLAASTWS